MLILGGGGRGTGDEGRGGVLYDYSYSIEAPSLPFNIMLLHFVFV